MWTEIDVDLDGVNDITWSFTYDSAGRILSFEEDSDADGDIDYAEYWTYDAFGNVTLYEIDEDGDGVADDTETSTYDASNNLLTFEGDVDDDGDIDAETYVYDVEGRLQIYTLDEDDDGTIEVRRTFSYDVNGLLVASQTDYGADGTIEEFWTYSYDGMDRLIEATADVYGDGKIDLRLTRTYNDPVLNDYTETLDFGDNGTIEQVTDWSENAAGDPTHYAVDTTPDGMWDFEYTLTYTTSGLLATYNYDIAEVAGGPLSLRQYQEYAYDPQDRLIDLYIAEIQLVPVEMTNSEERLTWIFGGTCP